jgi:hypothetical protein
MALVEICRRLDSGPSDAFQIDCNAAGAPADSEEVLDLWIEQMSAATTARGLTTEGTVERIKLLDEIAAKVRAHGVTGDGAEARLRSR